MPQCKYTSEVGEVQCEENALPDTNNGLCIFHEELNNKDIDKCIDYCIKGCFDSVISVGEIAPYIYRPNGSVYVFKDEIWVDNMGMCLMNTVKSIDIDTEMDFSVAECMMKIL